jgi:hypothetical protein
MAASLARNRNAPTQSSAWPTRPSGIMLWNCFICSAEVMPSWNGLEISLGTT